MLALLATASFALSASGQLTTALWMFSSPNFDNETNVGSVVDFKSDRTTVQFTVDRSSNSKTNTFTLGGLTYAEFTATASASGRRTATIVVACSRANEEVREATCLQSELGTESKMSEYCGSLSTREVQTTTEGFQQGTPEWCTNATAFSEEAKSLTTFDGTDMATYSLVLTAGLEKVPATATGSSKTGGSTSTPTGSVISTAAAVAVNVPALVGMGAMAAFFL